MRRATNILGALLIAGSVAAHASVLESPGEAQGTTVTNDAPARASNTAPASLDSTPAVEDPDELARQLELKRAMAEAAETPREELVPVAGLEAFRIISERNIFNPNRSSRSRLASGRNDSPRTVRRERFALVGTMSYEKGNFGFFDGSSDEYRKVAEPGQTIAGHRIVAIAPHSVTLASTNGAEIQLMVGMQMRREDDGDWQLSAREEPMESVRRTDSTGATAALATRPPDLGNDAGREVGEGDGGDENDEALKRLLQKREEEFNNEK